jgi:hypothetical protein
MVPDVSSVHFRTVLLAKLSEKLPALPMKEKKRLSKSAMRRKDESERLDVREELFKYRDLLSVPVEVSASEGKQLAEFESSMRQSFSQSTNGDCILLTSLLLPPHPAPHIPPHLSSFLLDLESNCATCLGSRVSALLLSRPCNCQKKNVVKPVMMPHFQQHHVLKWESVQSWRACVVESLAASPSCRGHGPEPLASNPRRCKVVCRTIIAQFSELWRPAWMVSPVLQGSLKRYTDPGTLNPNLQTLGTPPRNIWTWKWSPILKPQTPI